MCDINSSLLILGKLFELCIEYEKQNNSTTNNSNNSNTMSNPKEQLLNIAYKLYQQKEISKQQYFTIFNTIDSVESVDAEIINMVSALVVRN